ncbi:hypothetical protein ZIOFF_043105 [Zingiber officinale]|uniref:Uncharacterized protein n=1 Tax=Zingiber officinale TaxID=94328 RepID=A0A8J5KZB5_ZINOF|nr:hypothetical protein ZIOFF_043105 [Zingiber officinale]
MKTTRGKGPLSQCSGDMRSGEIAYSFENAHSTRVKGLVVLKNRSKSETFDESNLIASASSDGMIRVWDARMIAKDKPNHLAEADTKSRLTCLAGSFKKSPSPVGTRRDGDEESKLGFRLSPSWTKVNPRVEAMGSDTVAVVVLA